MLSALSHTPCKGEFFNFLRHHNNKETKKTFH